MTYVAIDDIAAQVSIQDGAIVSKVVHHDAAIDVTVFALDTGQGLTEHRAARTALVQVLSGRLRFTVDGMGGVTEVVYDAAGRRAGLVQSGPLPAGTHVRHWRGAAGVYTVRFSHPGGNCTARLVCRD